MYIYIYIAMFRCLYDVGPNGRAWYSLILSNLVCFTFIIPHTYKQTTYKYRMNY